jgi:hypothetical protein
MAHAIRAALDGIYDACAAYGFSGEFDDSYGALNPEVAARVASSPLRNIPRDDAADLFGVLFDDEEALKHFLPRLLEQAVLPWMPHHWPDLPGVLEAARRHGLLELSALHGPIAKLLASLWGVLHHSPASPEHVEDILCGSAWFYDTLAGPLTVWLEATDPQAQTTIASYVLHNADALSARRRLRESDRWSGRPGLEMEVCEWLRSGALWKRLRTLRQPHTPLNLFLDAVAFLNQLHTAPAFR